LDTETIEVIFKKLLFLCAEAVGRRTPSLLASASSSAGEKTRGDSLEKRGTVEIEKKNSLEKKKGVVNANGRSYLGRGAKGTRPGSSRIRGWRYEGSRS
jgi:hypothetical protein